MQMDGCVSLSAGSNRHRRTFDIPPRIRVKRINRKGGHCYYKIYHWHRDKRIDKYSGAGWWKLWGIISKEEFERRYHSAQS